MSEGPEWFAPRRYGYGSGTPISWQGWAVTLAYVAILIALALTLGRKDRLQFIAAMIIPTVTFCIVCARTTRGGWRWRWGEDD